jgi:hypothetical protein
MTCSFLHLKKKDFPMRIRPRKILVAAMIGLTSVAWVGCKRATNSQFIAGFSTQVHVPRDLRAVRVQVQFGGAFVYCKDFNVYDGVVKLPQTIGTKLEGDPDTPVTITVSGFTDSPDDPSPIIPMSGATFEDCTTQVTVNHDSSRILRRSVQTYIPTRSLYIPMPLAYSCFDVDCSGQMDSATGESYTCVGGKCVSPATDSNTLPDYTPDMSDDTALNTCFHTDTCLADAVPSQIVDAENCIFALPGTASAPNSGVATDGGLNNPYPTDSRNGLNVRVGYDDGTITEVLDLDTQTTQESDGTYAPNATAASEGFFIPDSSKPQQFQLTTGLCIPALTKLKEAGVYSGPLPVHTVTSVYGSAFCPSKTPEQPICSGDTPSQMPDNSVTSVCDAQELVPSPSSLAILVDPSATMAGAFVGNKSAAQVLGFPLADPSLRTTTIGFELLGDTTTCPPSGTGPAGTFPLTFNDATTAQSAIATFFQSAHALSNDPVLSLNASLASAYYQLKNSPLAASSNTLAVLLLADQLDGRANGCSGVDDVLTLAKNAISTFPPVRTYIVAPPINSNDPMYIDGGVSDAPLPAADDIISKISALNMNAGIASTTVFDTPSLVDAAFFNIVSDLGACLYVQPAGVVVTSASTLQYQVAGSTVPVVLKYSPGCANDGFDVVSETAGGDGGVNGQIRICQNSCANLRSAISAVSAMAAATASYATIGVTFYPGTCGDTSMIASDDGGFVPPDATYPEDASEDVNAPPSDSGQTTDANNVVDAGIDAAKDASAPTDANATDAMAVPFDAN